jgi:transcriptional regulator of heat shock response
MGQKINLTTEIDLDELIERARERAHGVTLELVEEMVRQKLDWDNDRLEMEVEELFDESLKEWTEANKERIQADIKAALTKEFDEQVDDITGRILHRELGIE